MITEAEARVKWCPFAMSAEPLDIGAVSLNRASRRGGTPDSDCFCIASRCMAWRGVETVEFKTRADAHFKKTGERLVSDTGFCGLAGRPAP